MPIRRLFLPIDKDQAAMMQAKSQSQIMLAETFIKLQLLRESYVSEDDHVCRKNQLTLEPLIAQPEE